MDQHLHAVIGLEHHLELTGGGVEAAAHDGRGAHRRDHGAAELTLLVHRHLDGHRHLAAGDVAALQRALPGAAQAVVLGGRLVALLVIGALAFGVVGRLLAVVFVSVSVGLFPLLLVALGSPGQLDVRAQRHGDQPLGALVDPGRVERAVGRREAAVAGEEQPITGAVEDRVLVREGAARDQGGGARLDLVDVHPRHRRVADAHRPGHPARVVRPARRAHAAAPEFPIALGQQGAGAALDLVQPGGAGLVAVEDALGVRRPLQVGLEGAVVAGELARLALAVGLSHPQLVLAALVAEVGDPAAIGAPGGAALGAAVAAGQVARRAVLGRQRPDVAAGRDRGPLTAGRDAPGHDVVGGIGDLGPRVDGVAGDVDLDRARLVATQVQQPQLGADLEHDLALALVARAHRRPGDVVVLEVGDLPPLVVEQVVAPDVQAVLLAGVRQVIERRVVPHRLRIGALPIGDLAGAVVLQVEQPDVAGVAAAVALPGAAVAVERRVGQPVPVRTDRAEGAVRHRQRRRHAAVGRHGHQAGLATETGEAAGVVEQPPVRQPVVEGLARRVVGQAHGRAAGLLHGVDVAVAFVVPDEGDGLAVGAEAREGLLPGRARQRHGQAAVAADHPQVVGVAEDDGLFADVGPAQHAAVRFHGGLRGQGRREQGEGQERPDGAGDCHLGHVRGVRGKRTEAAGRPPRRRAYGGGTGTIDDSGARRGQVGPGAADWCRPRMLSSGSLQ